MDNGTLDPDLPPPDPDPEPERFKDAAARLLELSDTVIRARAGPCIDGSACLALVLGRLIETHSLRDDTALDELDIDRQLLISAPI